jgi:hypothetical protein
VNALQIRFTEGPGVSREVGTLVQRGGRIFFEYAESWLRGGFSLSPFRLPFAGGLFEHRDLR